MKMKITVLILILTTVLLAGCISDDETPLDENITEEIPEDLNETINETPVENETEEEIEIEEEVTQEPRSYTIYLEHFQSRPSELEINKGDTVFWFNRNDPVRLFTIVSEDGLWENTTIQHRKSFAYTFNETGTYNYTTIEFKDRMAGTIIVK